MDKDGFVNLAEFESSLDFGLKLASGVAVVGTFSALIIGSAGSIATESAIFERLLFFIPSFVLSGIIVVIPVQLFHLLLKGFVKIAYD